MKKSFDRMSYEQLQKYKEDIKEELRKKPIYKVDVDKQLDKFNEYIEKYEFTGDAIHLEEAQKIIEKLKSARFTYKEGIGIL